MKKMMIGAVALALAAFAGALAVDVSNVDNTRGGYEPPYEGWTGTPIDWSAGEATDEGFARKGLVLETRVNCATGMLSGVILGMEIEYRKVSPRAIKVHKPREACVERGFSPEF